jgi:ABC-2 type transport system ATP-binding protein
MDQGSPTRSGSGTPPIDSAGGAAVEVENLTKYYGENAAIEGVTFSAQPGEILGLLGPNAAGKTTTMRIITGFMPPTSGTVMVGGFDIVRDSLEARRRMGYLPENVPLYEEMRVSEYLAFAADLRGVARDVAKERVRTVMNSTGVAEYADTLIAKLSRGYRQRVGIAQALVHDPPLIILDEPTVGLDPRQIIEIRELIRGLRGSHTVILSTHILPEAQMLCDRIAIIADGRVAAIDTADALTARLRRSQQVRVDVRGPAKDVVRALSGLAGVTSAACDEIPDGVVRVVVESAADTDVREAVAATVVRNGWGLREMNTVAMSLEDIFIRLTEHDDAVQEPAAPGEGGRDDREPARAETRAARGKRP